MSSKAAAKPQEQTGLMTMADLAARFALPESTARYYCRRFSAFLPQEGQGRRRYKPDAVPVFAVIQEAMRRTRHARSVEMELSLQFAAAPGQGQAGGANRETAQTAPAAVVYDHNPVAVMQEFSRNILHILNAQAQALERIADALSGVGTVTAAPERETTAPLPTPEAGAGTNAEIEALRKEIKTLRGLMDSSEQIHQQDVEQLRKWLNRLGSGQTGPGAEE